MKTLLTGIFMAAAMLSANPIETEETQAKMEMLFADEEVFQNRVKVYDYSGNLIQELNASEVTDEEITVTDYLLLESSDFAFEYLGDHYYFRE